MNLEHLLEQYQQTPMLLQLVNRLSHADKQHIYLKNAQGSAAEFFVSAVFSHPESKGLNHLIILNDAEEAAYFHNTV
ncbi:hypothetical protein ACUOG1_25420, partial [Escherichia coli]